MATGADLCYCGMNRVAASGSSFYYPVHAPRPGRALEDFLAENRAGTQTLLMHRAVPSHGLPFRIQGQARPPARNGKPAIRWAEWREPP